MSNASDSDDDAASGSFDDFDDSDATVVEDFTGEVARQLAAGICAVAINTGRFGNGLGDLGQKRYGHGDAGLRERAADLTTAHAIGCNIARSLRETLEHVTAANELIGKAASRARAQVPQAAR